MRIIEQPGEHSYAFSRYLKPIASVKSGEKIMLYTLDCFGGLVKNETDLPSRVLNFKGYYPNPQTGPLYIEGAEPGDTLKVHIHGIEPNQDWAVSCIQKVIGGLNPNKRTPMLNEPLEEKVYIYRFDEKGMLSCNERLSFPWEPFLGTIATAHDLEAISALTPYEQGGNMDVPDVKPGNIVYLPVAVEGAYFFTGDCHAKQGQGELCGTAIEIAAKVILEFELIKNRRISWPRIESPDELMTVGSARPMEDAARIAYAELIEWMTEYGWDRMEAYQALTQDGMLYCGNMVDTYYSMVAKVSRELAYRARK